MAFHIFHIGILINNDQTLFCRYVISLEMSGIELTLRPLNSNLFLKKQYIHNTKLPIQHLLRSSKCHEEIMNLYTNKLKVFKHSTIS